VYEFMRKNNRFGNLRKLISILLSVTLLTAMLPQGVYAENLDMVSSDSEEMLKSAPSHDGTIGIISVLVNDDYRDGKNVNGSEKVKLYLGSFDPSLSSLGLDQDKTEFSADKAGTGSHHLKSIFLVSKDGSVRIPLADSTASSAELSNMSKAGIKADYSSELEFTNIDFSKALNGTSPVPAGEYYILVTLNGELVSGASGGQTVFSTMGDDVLTVTASGGTAPVIKSSSFSGMEGQSFNAALSAVPAKSGNITWEESPSTNTSFSDIGLTLDPSGTISGKLKLKDSSDNDSGDRTYHISVIATESGNEEKAYGGIDFTITPNSAFSITTKKLPEAYLGKDYSYTLKSSLEADWEIVEGDLPEGFVFDTSTGVLSGKAVPGTGRTYELTFKASYKIDASINQIKTLTLAVRGDYSRILIPKNIIDSSKGISCWLQADFTTKNGTEENSWFWSGRLGEEKNGATLSANEAMVVPVRLYGGDMDSVFSNVRLMANVDGEAEAVEIAGSTEEKKVEWGESVELSAASPEVALTSLPDNIILLDQNGEKMTVTADRDISVTFISEDKERELSPGAVVRVGQSFEVELNAFSGLCRKYDNSFFGGFEIEGGGGRTYTAVPDPESLTFTIPDYVASETLSGRVLYALSGDEEVKNIKLSYYQSLPGGKKEGSTVTGDDGSFSVSVYPGADVYLSTPLSYRNEVIKADDIDADHRIYVNPGDTSACLDLRVSFYKDQKDSDTVRYIKSLPGGSTNVVAYASGRDLGVGHFIFVDNTEKNIRFRIWNSYYADILQNLASGAEGDAKRTVKLSWPGSGVINEGSQDVEVNEFLRGTADIMFPVKGGIVQKIRNTSPVNIRLKSLWFDHSTGSYIGSSGEETVHGLSTRDLSFFSPGDSGTYDIAVISTEMHPFIEDWDQFNRDYGSENALQKYEDIKIESGAATALPDASYDLSRISEQLYITKPRSSASAPAQFTANELVPVTGTIALDEGYAGKLKGIYVETNTPVQCLTINGIRYEGAGNPSGYIRIEPSVSLPCQYTLYASPRVGSENLDIAVWANINIDKGSNSLGIYENQLVGEVEVASPGLVMQLPESAGSNVISARLISAPPVDESGNRTEPYTVAVFDGDAMIYSERNCRGIKDRVVTLNLPDSFVAGQAAHRISAKAGPNDEDKLEWMDTVTGEVVIGVGDTPTLKAHYLDLYDSEGRLYDSLMSGRKYDWGPHTAVYYRVRAEFENDEFLDPDFGSSVLGEDAPIVFSVKMQNGQSLRLPGRKESEGVYVSEKQRIGSAVIQTQVDYAVKRDDMNVESGPDLSAPRRPFTGGVMEKTDIYKLCSEEDMPEDKLDLIDISEERVDAEEYALAFNDENKLYDDIVDNPEIYEEMADALEEELLDGGCYYIDPDTGKVDDSKVPEWTHTEGDDSKAPDLAKLLDNITVEGSQTGLAVTSLAITLDRERYESELRSFISTDFDNSVSPSSEVADWKGDDSSLKIKPGSGCFMSPETNVVTDKDGNVILEQTTCFYISEKDDGSSVMAEVQLTRARRVDDNGIITEEWDYGEDADIIGIAPTGTVTAASGKAGSSERPHRGSYAQILGVRVGCSMDLVSYFLDSPIYQSGSADAAESGDIANLSSGLNLLVSNALIDGIHGAMKIGENKIGSAGRFWRAVNAASGILAAGCTTISTIMGMKALADNFYEVESLTKTPCFKAMRAQTQQSILRDLDSFHQETNDAMFWTLVHGGFNTVFTLGSTFGINKTTKEALAGYIRKTAARKMTRTAAGKAAKAMLARIAGPLVLASALVIIETSLASLVSLSQSMSLDEHRWMLEEWIADSVEREAEEREDESCGYKKKKKDLRVGSGNNIRNSSGLDSSTYAPIYDPSGVVYAGVKSNPVDGSSVKLFKNGSSDLSSDYLIPADQREITPEKNVLTTGKDGRYAWMVPLGQWFVTAEADGFLPGNSNNDKAAVDKGTNYNWLPVPPPQIDVNIPLLSYEAPEIEAINFLTDGIYVTFDKYMDISDTDGLMKDNAFVLRKGDEKGEDIPFSIELPDKEKEPDNIIDSERDEYARNVILKTASPLSVGEEVFLEIDGGVLSYSGIGFGAAKKTGPWKGNVTEKLALDAPSLSEDSAEPGEVKQNVSAAFKDVITPDTDNGDTGRRAEIYFTLDGSDPTDKANSERKKYEGIPILIGQSLTIKAYSTLYGYNDSEVSSFDYSVGQYEKEYVFLDSDKEKEEEEEEEAETKSETAVQSAANVFSVAEIGGYTFKWLNSVSYNGRKHYPVILGGSGKNTKRRAEDVTLSITDSQGNPVQPSKIKAKIKKGRDAGQAQMTLKLKGKEFKSLNRLLKSAPFAFSIVPADISDPDIKLDVKFDKMGRVKKVSCILSGKRIRLKKKDFSVSGTDKDLTIEAKGNFTGKRRIGW